MQRRTRFVLGLGLLLVLVTSTLLTSPAWLLARLDWLAADPVRFVAILLTLALVPSTWLATSGASSSAG